MRIVKQMEERSGERAAFGGGVQVGDKLELKHVDDLCTKADAFPLLLNPSATGGRSSGGAGFDDDDLTLVIGSGSCLPYPKNVQQCFMLPPLITGMQRDASQLVVSSSAKISLTGKRTPVIIFPPSRVWRWYKVRDAAGSS